jgi:hypothetical protein
MQFGWFKYVTRSTVTSARAGKAIRSASSTADPIDLIDPIDPLDLIDPIDLPDPLDLIDPIDLPDPVLTRRTAPPLRAATSSGRASG